MRTEALRPLTLAAALALGAGTAFPARAEGLKLGVGQVLLRQGNLFRLADDVAVPAGLARDDRIETRYLDAALALPAGRQRLALTAQLQDRRHALNPAYDNTGSTAALTLEWQTIGRLNGTLGYSHARGLQTLTDELQTSLRPVNINTSRSVSGSAQLPLDAAWTLSLNGELRDSVNSAEIDAVRTRDLRQLSQTVRLGWRSRAGTTLGLSATRGSGEYPRFARSSDGQFVADRFETDGGAIDFAWEPGAAGTLRLRVGNNRSRHALRASRDFDGQIGSLGWTSRGDRQLGWSLTLQRDSGSEGTVLASSSLATPIRYDQARVVDSVRLAATLTLSAHLVARGEFSADRRTVTTDALGLASLTQEQGRYTAVGLGWAPRGWGQAGCDWRTESRRAQGGTARRMRADSLGCNWRLQWS